MESHWDKAERLLHHYIEMTWKASGLEWTYENDNEIRALFADLRAAVESEAEAAMVTHVNDAPHIYPDGSTS